MHSIFNINMKSNIVLIQKAISESKNDNKTKEYVI